MPWAATYVCGGDNVIAEIAPEPPWMSLRSSDPVPHDKIAVKAKRSVDKKLVLAGTNQRWQPARLSRVHEQEDGVVIRNQTLQCAYALASILSGAEIPNRMTRHWDHERVGRCILRVSFMVGQRKPTIDGKISFSRSAAQAAFNLPPSRQSSN